MLSDQREEKNKNTLLLIRGLAKKCRVDNRTAFAWLLLSLSDRANVRNHIFAQWLYKKITTHGVSYSHWYWTNVLLFLEKLSPVKNVQQVFYESGCFLKAIAQLAWKGLYLTERLKRLPQASVFRLKFFWMSKEFLSEKQRQSVLG